MPLWSVGFSSACYSIWYCDAARMQLQNDLLAIGKNKTSRSSAGSFACGYFCQFGMPPSRNVPRIPRLSASPEFWPKCPDFCPNNEHFLQIEIDFSKSVSSKSRKCPKRFQPRLSQEPKNKTYVSVHELIGHYSYFWWFSSQVSDFIVLVLWQTLTPKIWGPMCLQNTR